MSLPPPSPFSAPVPHCSRGSPDWTVPLRLREGGVWLTSTNSPSLTVRNSFIHLKSLLASSPSLVTALPTQDTCDLLHDCPARNCKQRSWLQNFHFSLSMTTSFQGGVSSRLLAQNQYCRWAVTHTHKGCRISVSGEVSKKIAFPFKGHLCPFLFYLKSA